MSDWSEVQRTLERVQQQIERLEAPMGEAICDAVLAERERCAKVADYYDRLEREDHDKTGSSILWYSSCIAAVIRSGEDPQ